MATGGLGLSLSSSSGEALTAAAAAAAAPVLDLVAPARWYGMMQTHERATLRAVVEGDLLTALLVRVAGDPDPVLRISLLVWLQDAAPLVADNAAAAARIFEVLELVARNAADPPQVRAQALATQTALSIELEALQTQAPNLEGLIELLLDIVSGTAPSSSPSSAGQQQGQQQGQQGQGEQEQQGQTPDTMLKETACQCLHELEESYPGLLCCSFPSIVEWVQREKTHALQDLVALAATVLLHGINQIVAAHHGAGSEKLAADLFGEAAGRSVASSSSSSSSSATTTTTATGDEKEGNATTETTTDAGTTAAGGDRAVIEALQDDTLRAVGALLGTMVDLSEWGMLRLVALFVPMAATGLVPATVLAPHCMRFVNSGAPLLLFCAAHLAATFPSLWAVSEGLTANVAACLARPAAAPHWRVLAAAWLVLLLPLRQRECAAAPSSGGEAHLRELAQTIAPGPFDSTDVQEARLCLLARCFARGTLRTPALLPCVLVCMDEFRNCRAMEKAPRQFFNVVHRWICEMPALAGRLLDTVLAEVLHQPDYILNVIALFGGSHSHNSSDGSSDGGSDGGFEHTLHAKARALLAVLPPAVLPQYLRLAAMVVSDARLDPTPVLAAMHALARRTTLCAGGSWHIGNDVLAICRDVLLHHRLTDVFHPLTALLRHIADNHADLDIRDRATFYLQLATHVPAARIREIVTERPTRLLMISAASSTVTPLSPADGAPAAAAAPAPAVLGAETPQQILGFHSVSAFLSLDRPETAPLFCSTATGLPSSSSFAAAVADTADAAELVRAHQTALRAARPTVRVPMVVRYLPTYKPGTLSPSAAPDDDPQPTLDTVYAVALELEQVAADRAPVFYADVRRIAVPHLHCAAGPAAAAAAAAAAAGPCSAAAVLALRPLVPLPSTLLVRATCNDAKGATLAATLQPVSVNFEDLLAPLPAPLRTPRFFGALWDDASLDPARNSDAMEASTHFVLPFPAFSRLIARTLRPFICDESLDAPAAAAKHVDLCFLMLPHYHLLVRISEHDTKSVTALIRTDFWRSLAFVDDLWQQVLTP